MSTATDADQNNPFPGLRPFREDEEHLFFGRENQVDAMVDKLAATHFLAVVGTSGSGKSSLVNCGLRPALHGGLMASAGSAWRMAQFRPGSNPMRAMARALAEDGVLFKDYQAGGLTLAEIVDTTLRMSKLGLIDIYEQAQLGEDVNLLVVVDQFEELFRYRQFGAGHQENVHGISEEAAAFVNLLLEAKFQTTYPIYVVLTMRSDFLGDCTQFPGLAEAINAGQYLVPRMTRDERRAAISGPVGVGGAEIAPVLLTRLVNDVGDNPDQLSILQHALNRTWNQRQRSDGNGPLDLPHYETIGTMAHALDQHAESAYAELATARQQQICEKLFKALTDKATDRRGVRRPTTLGTLCALANATPAEVTQVIDVFRKPSRSFLMPPAGEVLEAETVIDISHESLMRVWARLKTWADEEAQSAHTYSRLAQTAVLHGEGKAGLWDDPDLQVALDWREKNQPNKDWARRYHPGFENAIAFLQASEKKRADDAAERQRQQNLEVERARRELQQAEALAEAQQQRADAQRQKAEEQQQRLEHQARAASRMRRLLAAFAVVALLAVASTVVAFVAYRKAGKDRLIAEESEKRGRRLNYIANMNLATQAQTAGNTPRVIELLNGFLPADTNSKEDLRSFPWYYLWHNNHNELTTLKGHSGSVLTVAFSPDGKTLASASSDGTVKLWDTSTRQELGTLKGHSGSVLTVAFSPDGKTLASASEDKTVKLWDTSTRQELATLKGQSGYVSSVAFSPDGKTLASASEDKTVKLWDTSTRQELATLKSHSIKVFSVAFSPDRKTLALASEDNTVKLWDISTRQELGPLAGHSDIVLSVAFSRDGKTLASACYDGTLKLWDISTRKELATLEGHSDSVYAVAFSPDGKTLASASYDGTVKLWDTSARQELATLKGHSDSVYAVAFSPDGKTLASASVDHTVKLWDTSKRQELATLKGHSSAVNSVAFSPDGKTLASASWNETVKLWDTGTWQELATLKEHAGQIYAVAFSPDSKTLASASSEGTVKLWDTNTRRELATLTGHLGEVYFVAFSRDGKTLASAGEDKTVKLWDTSTWKELATLRGHSDPVRSVAFSPDGKTLASASRDRTVKLWDTRTWQELGTLKGHSSAVNSVAFSPDGKTLASASGDKTGRLWDTRTRQELGTLKGHASDVLSVAFSPDGKTLASSSLDKTVKLWDTSTRQELGTLAGHKGIVYSVAFSPDSKTLASVGEDKTVRLWIAAVTDQEVAAQRNK